MKYIKGKYQGLKWHCNFFSEKWKDASFDEKIYLIWLFFKYLPRSWSLHK